VLLSREPDVVEGEIAGKVTLNRWVLRGPITLALGGRLTFVASAALAVLEVASGIMLTGCSPVARRADQPRSGAVPHSEYHLSGDTLCVMSCRGISCRVHLMHTGKPGSLPLTCRGADVEDATISSDGSRVACVPKTDRRMLFLMDADGSNIRLLARSEWIGDPAFSPDSHNVAFSAERQRIKVVATDGTGVTTVVAKDGARPSYRPDGTSIVYESFRNGQYDVYLLDLRSGRAVRLSWARGDSRAPVFSPDGHQIVFAGVRNRMRDIYVMDVDGSNIRRLTSQRDVGFPSFSPDGQTVAYDLHGDIWTVRTDGGQPKQITREQGHNLWARFRTVPPRSPDR
jgi:Tol biopolymer transport system component